MSDVATAAATPSRLRRVLAVLRKVLKWPVRVLVVLILVAVVFLWWASGGQTNEEPVSPGEITTLEAHLAQALPDTGAPDTLKVVTFNIGYGRGPAGDYSGPWSREHIVKHLDGIAGQIQSSGAELAALQEVDLQSSRSHDLHEGRYLADKLGWPYVSCVVTWENNYVPFPYWPPSKHYGEMKSGQCLLSRYPIRTSTRHRLPQPEANPWWKNLFYLNRAIEHAEVAVGEEPLHVYNIHLEAFDTTNRERHAQALIELLAKNPSDRVLVLGDFNALPVGATKTSGFPDEPEMDYAGDTTMKRMAEVTRLSEALSGSMEPTHPSNAPDRRLDYIFHGVGLTRTDGRVLSDTPVWSDHLPVWASFRLTPRAAPPRP